MKDRRIEDYGLIGDCETAALVGRDGSIDWLCWPRFDSEACFAAILGDRQNGRWLIAPAQAGTSTSRRYRPHTLILETRWETATGSALVVDFMPPRGTGVGHHPPGCRRARPCRHAHGTGAALRIRPDHSHGSHGSKTARCGRSPGPDMVVLRTPAELRGANMHTESDFTVRAGETIPFALDLPALAPRHSGLDRSCRRAGGYTDLLVGLGRTLRPGRAGQRGPAPRALASGCRTLAHHAQGAHLRADGRHRGRRDHLVA